MGRAVGGAGMAAGSTVLGALNVVGWAYGAYKVAKYVDKRMNTPTNLYEVGTVNGKLGCGFNRDFDQLAKPRMAEFTFQKRWRQSVIDDGHKKIHFSEGGSVQLDKSTALASLKEVVADMESDDFKGEINTLYEAAKKAENPKMDFMVKAMPYIVLRQAKTAAKYGFNEDQMGCMMWMGQVTKHKAGDDAESKEIATLMAKVQGVINSYAF